jgi:MFS family permease
MTTIRSASTRGADTAPPLSRWLALVVLCSGMLMIILDATIVNVALPTVQTDLGFSQPNLAWVVNAYLIAFGGLLLLVVIPVSSSGVSSGPGGGIAEVEPAGGVEGVFGVAGAVSGG